MFESELYALRARAARFAYNSLQFADGEMLAGGKVLRDDDRVLLLTGKSREPHGPELYWAASSAEALLQAVDACGIRQALVNLVPSAWLEAFQSAGFAPYAVWRHYFHPGIDAVMTERAKVLSEAECPEAAAVVLASQGKSWGDHGASERFLRDWRSGSELSAMSCGAVDCAVLVKRVQRALAGLVCVGVYRQPSGELVTWIRLLAVHPDFSGHGIARHLVVQALDYGRRHGAIRAFVTVNESNSRRRGLYEATGFRAEDEPPRTDMIRMQRSLSGAYNERGGAGMKQIPQIYDYNDKCAVKDALFTPQSGVRLHDGLFKTVFDNNRRFLHKLDMGAMMYWFDQKTGTPTDAEPYRGHFEDHLKGSTLSMFLMGAANALRWVEDDSLLEKVGILLERLKTAAEPDGFLMPVDERDFAYREYPHYVRIWLTYALGAVGLACNDEAYAMLRKWQNWFNACPDLPIIRYLELAFQGIVASTYAYFTPVGERTDIDTAMQAYEEPWRLAQFMRREPDCVHIRRQPGLEPHAHGSELEGLEGYLDFYRATGVNYYRTAVLGAWELYRRDWQHAGGGIVMCENMPDNSPGCRWLDPKNHYNELCCSSFWLSLNLRLHRLYPDEEAYMNEVEKSLFNVAFANQEGGEGIRYFAFLEQKKQRPGLVHCCCGVGTRIFGSLPEYIYSVSYDALAVNLYTPSSIEWQGVTLTSKANIPYSEQAELTLSMAAPKRFQLRLRMPAWMAADADILVNGEQAAIGHAGSYVALERDWQDGDTVRFSLAMSFRLTKYSGAEELPPFSRYAIEYGPILYAVVADTYQHARMVGWSVADFPDWLVPTDTPLVYELKMKPGYRLAPYMDLTCAEEFTCYPVFND